MKKTDPIKPDELLSEYDFDYTKSRPNRFAKKAPVTITLDPDIAEVFTDSNAVNKALRALLSALPEQKVS